MGSTEHGFPDAFGRLSITRPQGRQGKKDLGVTAIRYEGIYLHIKPVRATSFLKDDVLLEVKGGILSLHVPSGTKTWRNSIFLHIHPDRGVNVLGNCWLHPQTFIKQG